MQLKSYRQAKTADVPEGKELGSETNKILIERIAEIARIEGPVHTDVVIDRLRESYRLGRVKGSTRTRIQRSIANAIHRKIVMGANGLFGRRNHSFPGRHVMRQMRISNISPQPN